MERINRVTVGSRHSSKAVAVTLKSAKTGAFSVSAGLDNLLGNPQHVEFFYHEKQLYISATTSNEGFLLRSSSSGLTKCFSSSALKARFFGTENCLCPVFTDPVELNVEAVAGSTCIAYEIKLPK